MSISKKYVEDLVLDKLKQDDRVSIRDLIQVFSEQKNEEVTRQKNSDGVIHCCSGNWPETTKILPLFIDLLNTVLWDLVVKRVITPITGNGFNSNTNIDLFKVTDEEALQVIIN